MRFRSQIAVKNNQVFEDAVQYLSQELEACLVCIIQQGGVETPEQLIRYIKWAEKLGIRKVIFREFAKLSDHYINNATSKYIVGQRISIKEMLLAMMLNEASSEQFRPLKITVGYYFWNISYLWKDHLQVVFEASDYKKMKKHHSSDVIYKLVYHANGHLTADWDPNSSILYKALR